MLIRDYFVESLQKGMYKKKIWALEIFSQCDFVVYDEVPEHELYLYQVVTRKGQLDRAYVVLMQNNVLTLEPLDDYKAGQPLCRIRGLLELRKGELENVVTDTRTTYGNAFVNSYVLIYPFGNKFDFITGYFKTAQIEAHISATLTDTPPADTVRDPKVIYVDEYLKYGEAMSSLEGFSMLCVQAASPSTMVPNPAVIKRRDELFKEYASQLDDPAIIAMIQMELSTIDKDSLKDDVSQDFYLKGKSYDVIRMKKYAMYGVEGGFGDASDAVLIKKSLDEGWEVDKIPEMVDSLRSGSFSRGKETALGGESVKTFYRIFQNVKISEEDCKTKGTITYDVREDNYNRYVGLNAVGPSGLFLTTHDNIKPFIGGKIQLRTPMLCKTQAPNFCEVCVGEVLASRPEAVHIVTSDVGSAFMGARMGAMHGKALRTVPYEFKFAIT